MRFFAAEELDAPARDAEQQLVDVLTVSRELEQAVRRGGPRAEHAVLLVDDCLQQPIFTVRQVQRPLRVTYARADALVAQLVALGVLRQDTAAVYDRECTAPEVLAVLLR